MWLNKDGRLIHMTDKRRVKFRTSISENLINELRKLAEKHNTSINYLFESGLEGIVLFNNVEFDVDDRPQDRVQFKSSYDKTLLNSVRKYAKENNVYINDVFEKSINYISFENVKKADYRYRVESLDE